jgi:hypothetical protein
MVLCPPSLSLLIRLLLILSISFFLFSVLLDAMALSPLPLGHHPIISNKGDHQGAMTEKASAT